MVFENLLQVVPLVRRIGDDHRCPVLVRERGGHQEGNQLPVGGEAHLHRFRLVLHREELLGGGALLVHFVAEAGGAGDGALDVVHHEFCFERPLKQRGRAFIDRHQQVRRGKIPRQDENEAGEAGVVGGGLQYLHARRVVVDVVQDGDGRLRLHQLREEGFRVVAGVQGRKGDNIVPLHAQGGAHSLLFLGIRQADDDLGHCAPPFNP